MRPRAPFIAALLMAGLAPAHAAVASWSAPVSVPRAKEATPVVVTMARGGRGVLVSTTAFLPYRQGDVIVDAFGASGRGAHWRSARSDVVDWARAPDGGVDLLIEQGAEPEIKVDGLALVRVSARGAVRRLWSMRGGGEAAVARGGGGRLAVAWMDYKQGAARLRLVTSRGGSRWSPARTISGVIPSWVDGIDPAFAGHLGLGIDGGGRLVFALTPERRRSGELVLATTTMSGRLLRRQIQRGPQGLVDVRPAGRALAVAVNDTGVEGEGGECVADGQPRRVWGAYGPGAHGRFAVRLLEGFPPVRDCQAMPGVLATGPGGRAAVAWGSDTALRVAIASDAAGFRRAGAAWSGARLAGMAFDGAGGLVGALPATDASGRPILTAQRRAPDGAVEAPQDLGPVAVLLAAAATDPTGRALFAWPSTDSEFSVRVGPAG